MSPSQHLRSTLGILILGATLALSACSTQAPGAAAIVDGNTISDKDVQTVTLQLNTLAQGQSKLTPSVVLVNLILAPYVLDAVDRAGKSVPDAVARKVISKVSQPSRQTLDFVRMQLAIPSLDNAGKTAILGKLAKAKITVNPRYGTFDGKNVAIVPTAPNWLKASASPAAK